MAKLTAQGGLGLPVCGDRGSSSFWCEPRFHFRIDAGKRFLDNQLGILHNGSSSGGGRGFSSPDPARVWARGKRSRNLRANEYASKDGEHLGRMAVDEEEEDEFQTDELSYFRGLVLDISYRPVNVVCWKRAICLEFMDKADVLEYYDQTVPSPNGSFYIPAVLQIPHLLQVVKRRRIKKNLSRRNIFYRDSFTCQYCSYHENLTVDHVLPISRGGEWKWENLVTACSRCNSRKGQKTLEEANMKLIKIPKVPKDYDIFAIPLTAAASGMLKLRKGVPDEWLQYLSEPSP